ncbi:MAG: CDGSH iron-sulfur domain-containing protein [Bacteroidia bacterium]
MTKGERAGNGPIAVEVEKDKSYYWCACGKSNNQPWCDGSHKGTELSPKVISVPETKTAWLCTCKQTNTPGFCDGSHKKI